MPDRSPDDIRNRVLTLKPDESAALERYMADAAARGEPMTRAEAIRSILCDYLAAKGYLGGQSDKSD